MSGYDDPYRYPRDDRRSRDFDPRPPRGYDDRNARGGHGSYGGRYDERDDRNYRDDRGRGGGYDGGRGHPRWEDEGRERDYKRPRYEDHDRGHGDFYPPQHAPQHHPYPPQPAHDPYGHPAYPAQHAQPVAPDSAPTRAPGRKPPVKPEAPSASVILLGLPAHVTEVHLRHFLEDMGASIESTTVIIDRATGISKRFGFAKFSSVEHARAFIDPNFPSIPWKERGGPGPDDGMRIKINYSQKSGGWREDQGATARLTDDQRRAEGAENQSFYINDGTRDIGSTPSQILLLRGLDPLSNEDEIFSSLSRVGGRASQQIAKGGVKKIYVAKDRSSRGSWGFAFVQFQDVKLATEVLAAVFNTHFHPTGFRIRNAIVAASFSHENSFIPVYAASPWAFRSKEGQQLAYWDDKSFVQPWTPPALPDPAALMKGVPKAPRAQEEAKADADLAAFFDSLGPDDAAPAIPAPQASTTSAPPAISAPPAPPTAASGPVSAAPPAPPKPASNALPPPDSVPPISIKPITALPQAAAPAPESETAFKPVEPVAAAAPPAVAATLGGKEKKGDLIVSRKAAGSIAKWNTKAKELRTVAPAPAAPASAAKPATAAASPETAPQPSASPSTPAAAVEATGVAYNDPEFEHGDPITFICLLCQRQFKGTNLTDADILATCATRKAASLKKHAAAAAAATAASTSSAADTKPKYVDRAAARREALGQSEHPETGNGKGKKKFEAPERAKLPEQPNKDGLDESNAGRKMLEKMGWSAGAGLGATGSGRVDAVQATQFAQGAGLGSTKGTAVGQYEDSRKGYTEQLKDKTLERYNAM
ncbi:hypothetical protein JCM10207_005943 [Rhodosporidiobolus poonsookiae]